ncbi:hypothetical protein HAX54_008956 [Datura stramonium]|uniref:Uncharacterized protein n=1 Tax=Datura stramonium TaxID=4076 RepID=A0ABS8RXK8_DATST|nr:hypothetical protein [Datura stramonium]
MIPLLLKTVKVLLNRTEISGDEIDLILSHYPRNTPTSLLLEERDPGAFHFLTKSKNSIITSNTVCLVDEKHRSSTRRSFLPHSMPDFASVLRCI